jgi:hypothetical protein
VALDLDNYTSPQRPWTAQEIYDPVNAWPGAPSRIYVELNRMVGGAYSTDVTGLYQTGFDPLTRRHWMRFKTWGGGAWTEWGPVPGDAWPLGLASPVPWDATLAANRVSIVLLFSLALDASAVVPQQQFILTVNGAAKTVVSVNIIQNGMAVRLVTRTDMAGATVTLAYAPPGLKSVDGVDVAGFSDFPVKT